MKLDITAIGGSTRIASAFFVLVGLTATGATAATYCAVDIPYDSCAYASPPANCKLIETQNDECIFVEYQSRNGRQDSTQYTGTCSYDVYTTDGNGECVFSHHWTGESQCERGSGRNCVKPSTGG